MLLSKLVDNLNNFTTSTTKPIIIFRSIGITPDSLQAAMLFKNIINEIDREYGQSESTLSLVSHPEALFAQMQRANKQRPLLIVIDGIDQLKGVERYLFIKALQVNKLLPDHVKLILSMIEPEETFKTILPLKNLVSMDVLTCVFR
jgi:hypothetical protein